MGWRGATIIARTAIDPRLVANEVRRVLRAMDSTLPVEMGTMRARIEGVTGRPRFYARLLTAFAGVGVLLAGIGLFGVMSFLVAQRRREIGVRMALGATQSRVVGLIFGFAARWTICGLAAGSLGSLLATRWLRTLLFQVQPADPWAFAAAAGLLSVVAMVSAVAPAWRASGVDPAETLREE